MLELTKINQIKKIVLNSNEITKSSASHSKKAKLTRNAQILKMLDSVNENAQILLQNTSKDFNAGYIVEDIINLLVKGVALNEHSTNDSKPDLEILEDSEYLAKGTYEIKYASDYSKSGKLNLKNDYLVILVSPLDIRLVKPTEINLEKDGRINYKHNLSVGQRLEKLYNKLF